MYSLDKNSSNTHFIVLKDGVEHCRISKNGNTEEAIKAHYGISNNENQKVELLSNLLCAISTLKVCQEYLTKAMFISEDIYFADKTLTKYYAISSICEKQIASLDIAEVKKAIEKIK